MGGKREEEGEREHSCLFSHGGSQEASGLHYYFLTVVCGFGDERLSCDSHCPLINKLHCCSPLLQEHHCFVTEQNDASFVILSQRKGHMSAEHWLNIALYFDHICHSLSRSSASSTRILAPTQTSYTNTERYVTVEKGICQIQPSRDISNIQISV